MSGSVKLCVITEYPVNDLFKWRQPIPDPSIIVDRRFAAIDDFRAVLQSFQQRGKRLGQRARQFFRQMQRAPGKRIQERMDQNFYGQRVHADVQGLAGPLFVFAQDFFRQRPRAIARLAQVLHHPLYLKRREHPLPALPTCLLQGFGKGRVLLHPRRKPFASRFGREVRGIAYSQLLPTVGTYFKFVYRHNSFFICL